MCDYDYILVRMKDELGWGDNGSMDAKAVNIIIGITAIVCMLLMISCLPFIAAAGLVFVCMLFWINAIITVSNMREILVMVYEALKEDEAKCGEAKGVIECLDERCRGVDSDDVKRVKKQLKAMRKSMEKIMAVCNNYDVPLKDDVINAADAARNMTVQNASIIIDYVSVNGSSEFSEEDNERVKQRLVANDENIEFIKGLAVVMMRFVDSSEGANDWYDTMNIKAYKEALQKMVDQKRFVKEFWNFG